MCGGDQPLDLNNHRLLALRSLFIGVMQRRAITSLICEN